MLSFGELKEMANGAWSMMYQLVMLMWLGICEFVKKVVNHDWRKEFRETVLSPQNRQEAQNVYYFCRFGIEIMLHLALLPFVMIYVAAENGVKALVPKRDPTPTPAA